MASGTDDTDETSIGDAALSVVEAIAGTSISIPAPIRKSAWKAFSHLCVAATDIPAAWLEGKAEEIRAGTRGRVALIDKATSQIAEGLNVSPEFADRASTKFAERVVKRQRNLDRVVAAAALELQASPTEPPQPNLSEKPDVDEDWLDSFSDVAGARTNEDMHRTFGRILAGEIQQPSSFSIRTVRAVAELDQGTATLFAKFCGMALILPMGGTYFDARVCALNGAAAQNSLLQFGLAYGQLTALQESGLIAPDFGSYLTYDAFINREGAPAVPLRLGGKWWIMRALPGATTPTKFRVTGPAMTAMGRQLAAVVDVPPSDAYVAALADYFRNAGIELVQVREIVPGQPSAGMRTI